MEKEKNMSWRRKRQGEPKGLVNKKTLEEIIHLAHLFDGVWHYVWLFGDLTNLPTLETLKADIDYLRQQGLPLSHELLQELRQWLYQPQVRKTLVELREWMDATEELNLEIYAWAKQICQEAGQEYGDKLEDGLGQIPKGQVVKNYQVRFRQADARGKRAILCELLEEGAKVEKKALPLLRKYGWMK